MWSIKGWICGGYCATREDGEMVFIYSRPAWGTGQCGVRPYFELRNRGQLVGRISSEDARRPQVRAEWLAETDRPLDETDLMDLAALLKF